MHQKILILDFGSQVTQLIARCLLFALLITTSLQAQTIKQVTVKEREAYEGITLALNLMAALNTSKKQPVPVDDEAVLLSILNLKKTEEFSVDPTILKSITESAIAFHLWSNGISLDRKIGGKTIENMIRDAGKNWSIAFYQQYAIEQCKLQKPEVANPAFQTLLERAGDYYVAKNALAWTLILSKPLDQETLIQAKVFIDQALVDAPKWKIFAEVVGYVETLHTAVIIYSQLEEFEVAKNLARSGLKHLGRVGDATPNEETLQIEKDFEAALLGKRVSLSPVLYQVLECPKPAIVKK